MSETHVAHTKALRRTQSLSESRGGSKQNILLVIVQIAIGDFIDQNKDKKKIDGTFMIFL